MIVDKHRDMWCDFAYRAYQEVITSNLQYEHLHPYYKITKKEICEGEFNEPPRVQDRYNDESIEIWNVDKKLGAFAIESGTTKKT